MTGFSSLNFTAAPYPVDSEALLAVVQSDGVHSNLDVEVGVAAAPDEVAVLTHPAGAASASIHGVVK